MGIPSKASRAGRGPVTTVAAAAGSPVALVCGAAALSVAAALAHLWIAPQLYVNLWGYGTFLWWGYAALYGLAYLGLGLYGVILLRWPTQPVFLLGIGTGVAVILLYLAGRSEGSFFGTLPGGIGEASLLDSAGVAATGGFIVALTALLDARYRDKVISALFVLGALAWGLRFAGAIT